jgi:Icc-related predicted phosphoesterase
MKKLILFLLLSSFLGFAQELKIIRGPYLQNFTPSSGVIRWRTDVAGNSKVIYGKSPKQLNQSVSDENLKTEHEIEIKNLSPGKKYYYAIVSSGTTLGGDETYYFNTVPKAGSTKPVRIWALGDFGNSSKNQANVRDAMFNATKTHKPDAWIWMGDNAYSNGKEEEYQNHVFRVYQDTFFKNLPVWPSPGNHDYAGKHDPSVPPYFKIFTMPTRGENGGLASGTESYYSFNYGNVHLISLDSEALETSDSSYLHNENGKQAKWLAKDLEANKLPWTIVYWHKPPYSKGSHDSDTEIWMYKVRENITPILEKYKVDLVICGHSHSYERTHPIVGHTGKNISYDASVHKKANEVAPNTYVINKGERQGTIYVVNGSGGQLGGKKNDYPLKASAYSNVTEGGSMLIDVDNKKMTAQWICGDGIVRDMFSIEKK